MSAGETRFHELLDYVLDGSASDAEREEFAALVDEHPEWMRGLAEEVFVHSLLQWQSEDVSFDVAHFGLPGAEDDGETLEARLEGGGGVRSPFAILRPWLLAAAAMLAVVGALMTWSAAPPRSVERLAVATVADAGSVEWSRDSSALQAGDLVIPGRLEATAGAFTLEFRSGPTVRFVAPASMTIESDMLVRLDRGQATAHVPKPVKGFTLRTPVVSVVDQGTEFGVVARESGVTDVVVFDGRVDLVDSISNGGVSKSLVRGEAARVDRRGSLERIMCVGRDRQGQWWTSGDPATGESLIHEVRDNVPAGQGSNYFGFQTTNEGLDEDAYAYADHPHQWNGLTAEGLPAFLRDAEYVQTLNDYRYMRDFEMVIELAKPANLYVFFDDRAPRPEWLEAEFTDTGVDIGLDEGPWEGIEDHRVDVGGGKSIDNVFSVWHRRCDGATPVVLGPMSATSEARAMYGIAVTALAHGESPSAAVPESRTAEPGPVGSAVGARRGVSTTGFKTGG